MALSCLSVFAYDKRRRRSQHPTHQGFLFADQKTHLTAKEDECVAALTSLCSSMSERLDAKETGKEEVVSHTKKRKRSQSTEHKENLRVDPIDDPYASNADESEVEQKHDLSHHKQAKHTIIEHFPQFILPARMHDNNGHLNVQIGELRLLFEPCRVQPKITQKKSLILGDLWIAASDFIRLVGPRRHLGKYQDKLNNLEQYAKHRCGIFKNNVWLLSLSHLTSMYKFRAAHRQIYERLLVMRNAIQTRVDHKNILLISDCSF
jgi:hypothetical protein